MRAGARLVGFTCTIRNDHVGPSTAQPALRFLRNISPAAWQAGRVEWSRDVSPANKVDDLIDQSPPNAAFNPIVNYNTFPSLQPVNHQTYVQP
jgi:hypothetical protein